MPEAQSVVSSRLARLQELEIERLRIAAEMRALQSKLAATGRPERPQRALAILRVIDRQKQVSIRDVAREVYGSEEKRDRVKAKASLYWLRRRGLVQMERGVWTALAPRVT